MWTFKMFEEYNSYNKYFCWIVLFWVDVFVA